MEVIYAFLDVVVGVFAQRHLCISSGPRRSKLMLTPAVRPEISMTSGCCRLTFVLISDVSLTYQD